VNIKRGLVRAWIVLTAFYVGNQLFFGRPWADSATSEWWALAWIFLLPPIAFAIALAALGWILDGFRVKGPIDDKGPNQ
jgi:Na+/proline symporter